MLLYLFFVFTCGWCVCYLLFLNYQQHSRDSQLDVELEAEAEDEAETEERQLLERRHWLRKWRRRRRRRACGHTGDASETTRRGGEQHRPKLELVIDSEGRHSLLGDEEIARLELEDTKDAADIECVACATPTPVSEPLFGWPLAEGDDEEEEAEQLCGEWPLAELHENPLSGLEVSPRGAESGVGALERSQLLSLRHCQRQNRAAIRMVSRRS